MTEEQFIFELERRGANLSGWPDDLRSQAEALIRASALAARHHREALALDQLLAAAPAPPAAEHEMQLESLIARIVALPQETARPPSAFGMPGSARLRYAACMAAVLAGFAVGALDGRRVAMPADLLDLALGPTGGLNVE